MCALRAGAHAREAAAQGMVPPPLVPGSRSLRAMLPDSYREGGFADRFIAGFDDTLAPVIEVLDCLDAYFTPRTAPADFLAWMLSWSATELSDAVGASGRRKALLLGERLHGLRGTRAGLELLAHEVLDAHVSVVESGGTWCTAAPRQTQAAHETPVAWVDIRIELPSAARRTEDVRDIEMLVREWIPAHVRGRIVIACGSTETVSEGARTPATDPGDPQDPDGPGAPGQGRLI